jgi:hypothetical protein
MMKPCDDFMGLCLDRQVVQIEELQREAMRMNRSDFLGCLVEIKDAQRKPIWVDLINFLRCLDRLVVQIEEMRREVRWMNWSGCCFSPKVVKVGMGGKTSLGTKDKINPGLVNLPALLRILPLGFSTIVNLEIPCEGSSALPSNTLGRRSRLNIIQQAISILTNTQPAQMERLCRTFNSASSPERKPSTGQRSRPSSSLRTYYYTTTTSSNG